MSTIAETLVDPKTGVKEQTWTGFSWPCLLLGVFWFLYKRLYGWSAITFLAALVTYGLAWFVFPFFANGVHRTSLQKAGWVPQEQAADLMVSPETHVRCPDCMELVRKDARVCKHCRATLLMPFKDSATSYAININSLTEEKLKLAEPKGFSVDGWHKKCPQCVEKIKLLAEICPFCKRKISSLENAMALDNALDYFLKLKK